LSQLSSETPACQDMSLGAEELNWGTEASELLSAVQWSESLAVKGRLFVCYSTAIFGVYSYSETVIAPVLKSFTRKRLVESVTDWGHCCACNGEL
jgi:hypothetical protein